MINENVLKNIPPKMNCRNYMSELTESLLKLKKIGDKTEFPRDKWRTLYQCAKTAKIKVTARCLGNEETLTVWRIE